MAYIYSTPPARAKGARELALAAPIGLLHQVAEQNKRGIDRRGTTNEAIVPTAKPSAGALVRGGVEATTGLE